MADLADHGRPEPPLTAEGTGTLQGILEYQRATLAWKSAGLQATVAASTMTLGGMVKHLALVEDYWLSQWLHGRDSQPPFDTVDWDADADWDWDSAAAASPGQVQGP